MWGKELRVKKTRVVKLLTALIAKPINVTDDTFPTFSRMAVDNCP